MHRNPHNPFERKVFYQTALYRISCGAVGMIALTHYLAGRDLPVRLAVLTFFLLLPGTIRTINLHLPRAMTYYGIAIATSVMGGVAYLMGGIMAPILVILPSAVAVAGFLLSTRQLLFVISLALGVEVLMFWFSETQQIPTSMFAPEDRHSIQLLALFVATFGAAFASRAINRHLMIADRSQSKLTTFNRHMSQIFDASHDYILSADAEGEIFYSNQSLKQVLTGKKPTKKSPDSLSKVLQESSYTKYIEEILPTASHSGTWSGEATIMDNQHEPIPVLLTCIAMHGSEDSVESLTFIMKNITQIKRQEQKLKAEKDAAEEATASKARFLANMSHEIRTPLNGILGITQQLRDGQHGPETNQKLDLVWHSGNLLMRILNDILDISRLDSHEFTIESLQVNPVELFRECFELHRSVAQEKGIDYQFTAAESCPEWVTTDPLRQRQVASNLISNAIKFTTTGKVSVHLDYAIAPPAAPLLILTVKDSGVGMTQEQLAHIFTPFSQADASTTRRFGGSGLGLSICKGLAKVMQAEISATSTYGEGSQFYWRCPTPLAAAPKSPSTSTEDVMTTKSPKQYLHFLIAEDNEINRMVICGFLDKLGCSWVIATNGLEAVARVRENSFDAILMDCHMPDMDGYDAAKEINRLLGASAPPIIALTASTLPEEQARARDCGMSYFLAKPLDKKALTQLVQELKQ